MPIKPKCKTRECTNRADLNTNGYCLHCFNKIMKIRNQEIALDILEQLKKINSNFLKLCNTLSNISINIPTQVQQVAANTQVVSQPVIEQQKEPKEKATEFIPSINIDDVVVNKPTEKKPSKKKTQVKSKKKNLDEILKKL